MRGTTSALRLVFGRPLGLDYDSEFLRIGNQRIHLFDAFSLVNYLLCSAVGNDRSKRGLATETMLKNCQGHFREAIRILEPSLIVVQGKGIWSRARNAFDEVTQHTENLYSAQLGPLRALVAAFTHPAAHFPGNWGANCETEYLRTVVRSTIDTFRAHLMKATTQ